MERLNIIHLLKYIVVKIAGGWALNQIVYKMMNMSQTRWRTLFDSKIATHQEDIHFVGLDTGDERFNIDQNDDGSIFLHFIASEAEEVGIFAMEEKSHSVITMPLLSEDNDRLIRLRFRIKFDPNGLAGHNVAYAAHMLIGCTIGGDTDTGKTFYGIDWTLDNWDTASRTIAQLVLSNAIGYVYNYTAVYGQDISIVNDTWYNFEILINLSKVDSSIACCRMSCYIDGVLATYTEEPIKTSHLKQGPGLRLQFMVRNSYTADRMTTNEFGIHLNYISVEVL